MSSFLRHREFLLAALLVLFVAASEGKTVTGSKTRPAGAKKKHAVIAVNATAAHDLWLLKNTTFVDVRNVTEYSASHISGALKLPANLVRQAINIGKPTPPSNKKNILCYEKSTEKAVAVCRYFVTSGKYKNVKVYALAKGLAAWVNAGYPVEA